MPRRHALPTLIAAVLIACAAGAPAALAVGASRSESDLLDSPRHGEDAISRLGDSGVKTAAARGGVDPAVLRSRLRQDPTSWLDRKGRFFVSDTGLIVPQRDAVPAALAAAASSPGGYDYSNTFLLHSRPGSNRVIYLDFDGETITGTSWNSSYTGGAAFDAEPFDTDGLPLTFSTNEQDIIQSAWQRVSEDYAAFDVDVTTQDPGEAAIDRTGPGDAAFGTRALITNTSSIYSSCNCGGMAYVGTFDDSASHASYQPAFVFQRGLGGRDTVAKFIAEAASHEVGHNLGLSHDGTAKVGYYAGQGVWAPIMGVGYYLPLTQWSRGEYAGANNHEDDLAVIQGHGASLLPDDHGNSQSTATALIGPAVSVSGRITTRTDTDWFSFSTGGGQVSFSLSPAPVSPDLDAKLYLRNSAGAVIASADLPSTYVDRDQAANLGASLTVSVPPGSYAVEVDGVGAGNPGAGGYSDYASAGAYTLAGTLPSAASPVPAPPTSVNATVRSRTVTLRWIDNASDETGYTVVRESQGSGGSWGSATTLASKPANTTQITDSPGRGTYRYTVSSFNGSGSSVGVRSNPVTV